MAAELWREAIAMQRPEGDSTACAAGRAADDGFGNCDGRSNSDTGPAADTLPESDW